ncbi:AAA family ATPase [Jhaorihella thermophila]
MQITSIRLKNVRRFVEPVEIAGIGPGLNVLSAPNEAGKSTFFDALHAAFFAGHRSWDRSLRALQPRAGGRPAGHRDLSRRGRRLAPAQDMEQDGQPPRGPAVARRRSGGPGRRGRTAAFRADRHARRRRPGGAVVGPAGTGRAGPGRRGAEGAAGDHGIRRGRGRGDDRRPADEGRVAGLRGVSRSAPDRHRPAEKGRRAGNRDRRGRTPRRPPRRADRAGRRAAGCARRPAPGARGTARASGSRGRGRPHPPAARGRGPAEEGARPCRADRTGAQPGRRTGGAARGSDRAHRAAGGGDPRTRRRAAGSCEISRSPPSRRKRTAMPRRPTATGPMRR